MTNRRAEVCKKQFRKMINGGIWCVCVVSMKRLSHENKQKHQKIIYKQQNKKKTQQKWTENKKPTKQKNKRKEIDKNKTTIQYAIFSIKTHTYTNTHAKEHDSFCFLFIWNRPSHRLLCRCCRRLSIVCTIGKTSICSSDWRCCCRCSPTLRCSLLCRC